MEMEMEMGSRMEMEVRMGTRMSLLVGVKPVL